jgi:putative ABC transport system permease protein
VISEISDYSSIALRHLWRKRLRFLLTVLGIAIGVAAVIATISLGEGIRYNAVETIKTQSDLTLVTVQPEVYRGTMQFITGLRIMDIRNLSNVMSAEGVTRDTYSTARQTFIPVLGIDSTDEGGLLNLRYSRGRPFSPETREVVAGYRLGEKLQRYEGIRLLDRFTVTIREYDASGKPLDTDLELILVGVLQERGDAFDETLLADRSSVVAARTDAPSYDGIFVRVDSPEHVAAVVEKIRTMQLGATGAFEQIESVNRLMDMVVLLLALFAAISLVVGALMIMNTMMTSVFERVREIGITMAVGASDRDVIRLILTECLIIGVAGGIIGDILGVAFAAMINTAGRSFILSRLGEEFAVLFGAEIARVTPGLLLAGLVVSVLLAVISGLYPAVKAARLNPVEAIRTGI